MILVLLWWFRCCPALKKVATQMNANERKFQPLQGWHAATVVQVRFAFIPAYLRSFAFSLALPQAAQAREPGNNVGTVGRASSRHSTCLSQLLRNRRKPR